MNKKYNVLYIMADQFNASCMGVAGRQIRTPNLDKLANDGIRFNRAYCNNPVCSPSRISFITGQYPHTHRIFGNDVYEAQEYNENTLSAVFRRQGYQTSLVGKSHMIKNWDREGFEYIRYCDLCDCDRNDPLDNHYFRYLHDHGIAHLYDLGRLKEDHPGNQFKAYVSEIPECHSLEMWTGNTAIEFLKNKDESRPFFMHLSFQRPHEPLSVPYDRGLLYDCNEIALPTGATDYFENRFASKPEIMKEYGKHIQGYPYIPESEVDLQRQMAFYYSLITLIDEQIGRVIETLKEMGEYDNTIIVFTADHGDFAGEHGMILKNLGIYESVHRIPFLLKYPNCEKNKVVDEMIESVDLYPTMCELCGIQIPKDVEGQSVIPIVENGKEGKQQVVCEWEFLRYRNKVNAIRTSRYRMVYYGYDESGELYDIEQDPHELENLYNRSDFQKVKLELLQKMFDHVNRYEVKASFAKDEEIGNRTRNCMTRMLSVGRKNWNEIKSVYRT